MSIELLLELAVYIAVIAHCRNSDRTSLRIKDYPAYGSPAGLRAAARVGRIMLNFSSIMLF